MRKPKKVTGIKIHCEILVPADSESGALVTFNKPHYAIACGKPVAPIANKGDGERWVNITRDPEKVTCKECLAIVRPESTAVDAHLRGLKEAQ